jgi:hypothetical protein
LLNILKPRGYAKIGIIQAAISHKLIAGAEVGRHAILKFCFERSIKRREGMRRMEGHLTTAAPKMARRKLTPINGIGG